MNGVQKTKGLLYKSKVYLQRASPTILACVGVIGVIATAVMAVKATTKAVKLCEGVKSDNGDEEPTTLDYVKTSWQCYIPTAIVGLSTISCIFGANMLNKRNQASLVSAYALLSQSYQRYRKAANSIYGDDADSRITAEVAKKVYVSEGLYGTSVYDPDSAADDTLFYDSYFQRYFTSTMATVLNAQYHLNRNFALRGEASINEFYAFMGLEEIRGGDAIGWDCYELVESGIQWIDFENKFTKMDDGLECYIVSPLYGPMMLTMEK